MQAFELSLNEHDTSMLNVTDNVANLTVKCIESKSSLRLHAYILYASCTLHFTLYDIEL